MPLLSLDRINQWVPLDFMLKTDKMKLPLHEFSFVKATASFCLNCNDIHIKKLEICWSIGRKK